METLAQTSLVVWVASSEYGYPITLTFHAIGMGLVVGLMLVLDLRVVGVAKSIKLSSLPQFFKIAWIGLLINLTSGSLIFFGSYSGYLKNTAFITKISLLIAGSAATFFLIKGLKKHKLWQETSDTNSIPGSLKVLAICCILLWLGATTAGRIVGYTLAPF